jgi:hypothetical protein
VATIKPSQKIEIDNRGNEDSDDDNRGDDDDSLSRISCSHRY